MVYSSSVTSAPTTASAEALSTPRKFVELVAPDLLAVEEELERNLSSDIVTIREVGEHILAGGGKRLRPALLLLSSHLIGFDRPSRIPYAAVVEMIHTATLVHDDVIDDSDKRRGRESINFRWGNHLTVLVGDYLYTHAMKVALSQGRLDAVDLLCDTTIRMTEGEILGLEMKGRADVSRGEYFDLIGRKTASLFAAGCRLPGLLADSSPEVADALEDYGYNLGIAFQLVDDLLDFTSTESAMGKPSLADLKDGKLTLPLILIADSLTSEESQLVREIVSGDRPMEDDEKILQIVSAHGGIDQTRRTAREYAERARAALTVFPPSTAREALEYAVDFVLDRDR